MPYAVTDAAKKAEPYKTAKEDGTWDKVTKGMMSANPDVAASASLEFQALNLRQEEWRKQVAAAKAAKPNSKQPVSLTVRGMFELYPCECNDLPFYGLEESEDGHPVIIQRDDMSTPLGQLLQALIDGG